MKRQSRTNCRTNQKSAQAFAYLLIRQRARDRPRQWQHVNVTQTCTQRHIRTYTRGWETGGCSAAGLRLYTDGYRRALGSLAAHCTRHMGHSSNGHERTRQTADGPAGCTHTCEPWPHSLFLARYVGRRRERSVLPWKSLWRYRTMSPVWTSVMWQIVAGYLLATCLATVAKWITRCTF